jgi:uroporphyrinogen-III synthase
VHIDVIPGSTKPNIIVDAVGSYVSGQEALGRLNFLVPRASAAREELCDTLENAGARVDVVVTYRSVSNKAMLAQLTALLTGGGIDSIAFTSPSAIRDLAELLDTIELNRILDGMTAICLDHGTTRAANEFGLRPLLSPEPTVPAMAEAIADHFHDDR